MTYETDDEGYYRYRDGRFKWLGYAAVFGLGVLVGALLFSRGCLCAPEEEEPEETAATAETVAAEVPARCHPLSAENKLVFAPGTLAATAAPCSGRLSVGAKSPLTGGIKESNAGGTPATALGKLGISAIVVEGQAADGVLHVLKIDASGARLLPAKGLKNKRNYALTERLREEHGARSSILSIGPAGEMKLAAATIAATDREGRPTEEFPHNPNGSPGGMAGLCDPTGRVFGMMPHPEAYHSPYLHPLWPQQQRAGTLPEEGSGLQIFKNAAAYLRE